jgi:hypothetical protein
MSTDPTNGQFRKYARIAGDSDAFFSLTIGHLNRDGKADIIGGNTGRARQSGTDVCAHAHSEFL